MTGAIRFRKALGANTPAPIWPHGTRRLPLTSASPEALHAILADAYATGFGQVPPLADWWSALTADAEYDPELMIIAATDDGKPIGLVQGWTSAFIRDFAVVAQWRGRGVGRALLLSMLHAYHLRGASSVDLKVVHGNHAAIDLYRDLGMSEAPL